MRIPLFRDAKSFPAPSRGPLLGKTVLVVVAPTDCDADGVAALHRALRPLGVRVSVTMECHGEARAQNRRLLFPESLLIEARPEDWDALVLAGGQGACRVAEDPFARELAQRFSANGRVVASLGEGARVLKAARLPGVMMDDPEALAEWLASHFGFTRSADLRPARATPP